jgi:hypothetical protein
MVVERVVIVLASGAAIYVVLPRITEVFASWPPLSSLSPIWFIAAVAAEVAHFGCDVALQRMALNPRLVCRDHDATHRKRRHQHSSGRRRRRPIPNACHLRDRPRHSRR